MRAKLLLPLTVSLVVQCSWAGTFFRAGAWQVEYHPGTQYIGCSATTSAPSGPTLSLSIGPRAVHEADGARVLFRHALTAAYRAHPAATPAGFRFDSANGTRTVEHKAPLTREALVAARDLVHTLVQQRAVSIVPKGKSRAITFELVGFIQALQAVSRCALASEGGIAAIEADRRFLAQALLQRSAGTSAADDIRAGMQLSAQSEPLPADWKPQTIAKATATPARRVPAAKPALAVSTPRATTKPGKPKRIPFSAPLAASSTPAQTDSHPPRPRPQRVREFFDHDAGVVSDTYSEASQPLLAVPAEDRAITEVADADAAVLADTFAEAQQPVPSWEQPPPVRVLDHDSAIVADTWAEAEQPVLAIDLPRVPQVSRDDILAALAFLHARWETSRWGRIVAQWHALPKPATAPTDPAAADLALRASRERLERALVQYRALREPAPASPSSAPLVDINPATMVRASEAPLVAVVDTRPTKRDAPTDTKAIEAPPKRPAAKSPATPLASAQHVQQAEPAAVEAPPPAAPAQASARNTQQLYAEQVRAALLRHQGDQRSGRTVTVELAFDESRQRLRRVRTLDELPDHQRKSIARAVFAIKDHLPLPPADVSRLVRVELTI